MKNDIVLPALSASPPLPKYSSHDSSRLLGENSHVSQEIILTDSKQYGDAEIRSDDMADPQYDQWIKMFKTEGKDRKKRTRLLRKLALKGIDANDESLVSRGKNTGNGS